MEEAEQVILVGHHAVVVYGRIAHVDTDRIYSVAVVNFEQALGGRVQGFLPADLLPADLAITTSDFFNRLAQAIRILMQIL